ncbi:hypothetical protein [Aureispira anguillae]|uniref:Outer membrane protein beta-barrel domain-containing protein n=1 Tax=Aureispira anguillae TaxID=2864201 RepID=A0A915YIP3_9BACT|nr:hypothetical protein [Aureispira anguillae]BDS13925.1 hypothetical protein AsAng_0046880 [Aureispira anguillae]
MKYTIAILLATLMLFGSKTIDAQKNYNTAIGGRIGPSYGFTVKHFLGEKIAIEGLVTSRYFGDFRLGGKSHYNHWNSTPGINIAALVEWHFPIGRVEGFNWFIGGGAHIGVWGGYTAHPWLDEDRPYFLTGLDVIGGVEYTFSKIPLTLQADIKPSIHFVEYLGVWYDQVAISARYTF